MSVWLVIGNVIAWVALGYGWLVLEGRIARNNNRLEEVERTIDKAKKWGKFKSKL